MDTPSEDSVAEARGHLSMPSTPAADDDEMFAPCPNVGTASHVFNPSHDSTTTQAGEASSHHVEAAAPLSRQISLPRPFACGCVGLYGACVCGYLQRLNRRIKMGFMTKRKEARKLQMSLMGMNMMKAPLNTHPRS